MRKDRQKAAASGPSSAGNSTADLIDLLDVDIGGGGGGGHSSSSSSISSSSTSGGLPGAAGDGADLDQPRRAADVAAAEAAAGAATVAVVWCTRAQGHAVYGFHCLPSVSLAPAPTAAPLPPPPTVAATAAALVPAAVDCLSVGLTHAPQAVLPDRARAFVHVAVDVRSSSARPITVSVEVIDRKSRTALSADPAADPATVAAHAAALSAQYPTQRGLRWEHKTSVVDVAVPPHGAVSLPFLATMARGGVYDLNRFKVLACYGDAGAGSGPAAVRGKCLTGNSLVEVVPAGAEEE